MGELSINNSGLPISRTPELIAAEINSIKQQTKNMVLYNSIEIGRRLVEAKALVEHGKWGEWLKKSVDYSQRTANNLMRIFEEYGADQLTLLGNNANSQALANLSYTQAVALLGVPEEEREQFVREHDIENMSTRELQEAIKERDQARKEKLELEEKLKKAREDFEAASDGWENEQKKVAEVKALKNMAERTVKEYEERIRLDTERREKYLQQIDELKEKLKSGSNDSDKVKQLERELQEAKEQVQKLTEEINTPREIASAVIENIPEETEKELHELREKVKQQPNPAIIKFKVYFDDLVKNFQELLGALAEIKDTDEQTFERYKNATSGLISKMNERLI